MWIAQQHFCETTRLYLHAGVHWMVSLEFDPQPTQNSEVDLQGVRWGVGGVEGWILDESATWTSEDNRHQVRSS